MSQPTTAKPLDQLQVGDPVQVRRNMDHPAWTIEGTRRVGEVAAERIPDPTLDPIIATSTVIERRDIPAIPGWGGRPASTRVRLSSGLWYDLGTGFQENSDATLIVPL